MRHETSLHCQGPELPAIIHLSPIAPNFTSNIDPCFSLAKTQRTPRNSSFTLKTKTFDFLCDLGVLGERFLGQIQLKKHLRLIFVLFVTSW
jgi:hypothetical protein